MIDPLSFGLTPRRRAQGGGIRNQALGHSRAGLTTKIHVRADAKGRPLAFALTGGEAHDITGVDELMAAWDWLPSPEPLPSFSLRRFTTAANA